MKRKKHIPMTLFFGLLILLILGAFAGQNQLQKNEEDIKEVTGKVIQVNNDEVVQQGIIKIGSQRAAVEILDGDFQGEVVSAMNFLQGKMDLDNFYEPGDKVILGLLIENNQVKDAKVIDMVRQDHLLGMFLIFIILLLIYAKTIGVKALFSFVASLYVLWEIFIPGLMEGKNPLVFTVGIVLVLSAIIIFSVGGFTKKGIAAFLGTSIGLCITIGVTLFFGDRLSLHGMTQPYVETLIFNGYFNLNFKHIFFAAIIVGASGAAMDISMDVAAAMEEVKKKKPEISMKELIQSGISVGKAVIGTMATTLLLAYSGGYLTLLMVFISKESSLTRILNYKIMSAEIMRTLSGSIGLVLVAPITALVAGWIYSFKSSDE